MKRKRLRNLSKSVQQQIVAEYIEKLPGGNYRFLVKQIADNHEVSLSTVFKLVKRTGCQERPRGRGGHVMDVPDAQTFKILRDASDPHNTYSFVGIINPRPVTVIRNGKSVTIFKPRSKARIHQIVKRWSKIDLGKYGRGFKPGEKIVWNHRVFTVVRYDSSFQGAAIEDINGKEWDPFVWNYQGMRSRRKIAESKVPE